jgi:hypothetical protein
LRSYCIPECLQAKSEYMTVVDGSGGDLPRFAKATFGIYGHLCAVGHLPYLVYKGSL